MSDDVRQALVELLKETTKLVHDLRMALKDAKK